MQHGRGEGIQGQRCVKWVIAVRAASRFVLESENAASNVLDTHSATELLPAPGTSYVGYSLLSHWAVPRSSNIMLGTHMLPLSCP